MEVEPDPEDALGNPLKGFAIGCGCGIAIWLATIGIIILFSRWYHG